MSIYPEPARLDTITQSYDRSVRAHAFVQWAIAQGVGAYKGLAPYSIFEQRWPNSPYRELIHKAAIQPATTVDPAWAGGLVSVATLSSAYVELTRSSTVLGRLTGARKVPFYTRVTVQTAGTFGAWVGEGKPTPVGQSAFTTTTFFVAKLGMISVTTSELALSSDPAAEPLIEQDLQAGIAAGIDKSLLDPTIAEVPALHPASLTNGAPSIVSTGSTAAQVEADLKALQALVNGGVLRVPYLVMKPTTASYLMTLRDATGAKAFPDVAQGGGSVWGIPILTSDQTGNQIVLIESKDVLYADGGQEVSSSAHAMLEMDSAPTDPPSAATTLVSLYQDNLIGIKGIRFISWMKARASSVAYISGVAY